MKGNIVIRTEQCNIVQCKITSCEDKYEQIDVCKKVLSAIGLFRSNSPIAVQKDSVVMARKRQA